MTTRPSKRIARRAARHAKRSVAVTAARRRRPAYYYSRGSMPKGLPRGLVRRSDDRIIGGVASGIGRFFGVDPVIIRLAFVLMTLASGIGIGVYAVAYFVMPDSESPAVEDAEEARPAPARGIEQAVAVGFLTVGGLLLLRTIGLWFPDRLIWPAAIVAVGFGLVWAQTDEGDDSSWRVRVSRIPGDPLGVLGAGRGFVLRLMGGVLLLVVGLGTLVASNARFATFSQLGLAVVAAAIGVGLLVGPWMLKLWQELGHERRERIRSEEKAEMAAHLHDSVLQTLALIQRRADSPHETVSLARRQERELRSWLYGGADPATPGATIGAALAAIIDEVEADHPVTIDLVAVGDVDLDDRTQALVLAAREAIVNAAKHAGVDEVSVYVEVDDHKVAAFVRDRGKGFDPDEVDPERHGLCDSIVGRMERHGGSATVSSTIGEGTEIGLEMSRDAA